MKLIIVILKGIANALVASGDIRIQIAPNSYRQVNVRKSLGNFPGFR